MTTENALRERRIRVNRGIMAHENTPLAIFLAALIAASGAVTKGLSVRPANMANILANSSVRGLGAIGETFVILVTGIDLSIGGVGKFASVIGASMMTQAAHLSIVSHPAPIFVGMLATVLVGLGFGALNGLGTARIMVPALITTLAMWKIADGFTYVVTHGRNITNLPDALGFFGTGKIGGIPVLVIVFVVVAILAYFVLNYTRYGRAIYAIGGNSVSAWLSGINVRQMVFSVYLICGLLAGLAATLTTARTLSASFQTLTGFELDAIAAAVVGGISLMGGRGNIIGTVLGNVVIGVVNNMMAILGAKPTVQGIGKGAIIFIAVAVDVWRRRR